MATYQFGDHRPEIHPTVWVAENARVIGRVRIGESCSVWYGAVLRADNDVIEIGARSNVQDGCLLHVDPDHPISIGEGVTVGQQVMLHGCTIGDNTLVGIQSVILNDVRIGRDSIVGACSLVTAGKVFPDGVLIAGSPAKVVRELSPEQIESNRKASASYIEQAHRHRTLVQRID